MMGRRWTCFAVLVTAAMTVAAQDGPVSSQLILPGETFEVDGHNAFVFLPSQQNRVSPQPWILYAPTFVPRLPDSHEKWMHQQFLDSGIAIAGIDVGEAYGSPKGNAAMDALYDKLVGSRGFAKKPCLLGRSRGGLWVSSWAIRNPDRVAGIAGIYPVFDLESYPGLGRAAGAFDLTETELKEKLTRFNPIDQVTKLANSSIPVLIIHGTDDKVVPIEKNSGAFVAGYQQAGKAELAKLISVEGQGHNFWQGFFRSQELISFAKSMAQKGAQ